MTRPVTRNFAPVRLPDLGGAIGADRAGKAKLLFAEDFLQFRALDGDELRIGGEVGVDERGDFRAEVAHGFVPRFKIENGDSENIRALRAGHSAGQQQGRQESGSIDASIYLFVVYGLGDNSGRFGGCGFIAYRQKKIKLSCDCGLPGKSAVSSG